MLFNLKVLSVHKHPHTVANSFSTVFNQIQFFLFFPKTTNSHFWRNIQFFRHTLYLPPGVELDGQPPEQQCFLYIHRIRSPYIHINNCPLPSFSPEITVQLSQNKGNKKIQISTLSWLNMYSGFGYDCYFHTKQPQPHKAEHCFSKICLYCLI